MNYKEKINQCLKINGFIKKDDKMIYFDGIHNIQSNFDELGNWNLHIVTTTSQIIDGSMLKKIDENNKLNDKFLAKIFSKLLSKYEDSTL